MKTFCLHFLLTISFCFAMNLSAQIPRGTTAPEWTATDIDGNTWEMYDILNSGKHVVLEFSTVWCGFCWDFHNTGTLEAINDIFGPKGTNQIRVFYIEADLDTNTDCLFDLPSCNSSSQGDWVTNHDFPFIDLAESNAPSMAFDYQVGYYPTIYAVSAKGNNGVYEIGQETNISNWESWFFESFEMELSAVVTDAICPGDGAIQVSVTNGAGSLSYQWSDGTWGSDNISGLETGFYSVTVTDENEYEIVRTFEVGGTMDVSITVELLGSSEVVCFGGNTGALSIEGLGGSGDYSYAWSNGLTGSYIDGLVAGEYTVQITDSEGCTGLETYSVAEPKLLTLTSFTEDANCGVEDGSVVASATGGIVPWTYDYGNGSNFIGIFENVAPGDYVMTVTDDNGCTELSPFTINSVEGPMIAVESSDVLDCSIAEVTLSGQGSSEGDNIEYSWSTADGNIVEGANKLEAIVDAVGTYTLLVIDANSGCSEAMSITVEANVEAPINMIIEPETLTCTITAVTLDASESSTGDNFIYSWTSEGGNITSGANTNMAKVDAAGDYTLLITNTDNGCTTSKTISVALDDALPSVSVEDEVIDCTTTEVELCADVEANTVVAWMTDYGEVEANCITVSMAGTFIAIAKGANGCVSTTEAVVTLSDDLPQVHIDQPETITCTVTSVVIDADFDGNIENFDISWTNNAGEIINSGDLSIEVFDGGIYTLSVENTSNGCTTVSSVTVDEVIINPESAFTTNLNDGVLELSGNSTGDPSAFSWSFGSDEENPNIIFDETGTYEICLTVTNDCGDNTYCEDVYFVSQLTYQIEKQDVLCFDEAQGYISIIPSGGEPGYSITWAGPNGFTSTELDITNLVVGDYNMVLTDNYGYEKTETYALVEPSEITQTLVGITDETNNDENGSISINVSGGTGSLTYLWSNGETTAIVQGLSAGEYSVYVTDENDCTKTFGPFEVMGSVVGVIDLDFVAEMQIYPVPALNYLNVNIELNNVEATQLQIIDAFGKIISTDHYDTKVINTKIDVTNLAGGIYYLEFGNKTVKTLEKFIVVR